MSSAARSPSAPNGLVMTALYFAILGSLWIAARALWLMWGGASGGGAFGTAEVAAAGVALLLVQPLATWQLARTIGCCPSSAPAVTGTRVSAL